MFNAVIAAVPHLGEVLGEVLGMREVGRAVDCWGLRQLVARWLWDDLVDPDGPEALAAWLPPEGRDRPEQRVSWILRVLRAGVGPG